MFATISCIATPVLRQHASHNGDCPPHSIGCIVGGQPLDGNGTTRGISRAEAYVPCVRSFPDGIGDIRSSFRSLPRLRAIGKTHRLSWISDSLENDSVGVGAGLERVFAVSWTLCGGKIPA